ncbi:DUF488 domain-containing protein [Limosilactobacillus mucosae]|uniref:DUF488 domain-containing protein n=1 Tax=Limosilactobacillus mucosae TaxID=97478 RepID=UPI000888EEB9|nr:DUF488 family protein [Limosilactobacillus mucosae]SDM88487.1 Uncharacterized conserved protein YeaO, DUF488 family [Limosilactobacillus mucosae]SEK21609.1 Uncharacterized conserved protein YeaO, DUF488 family [Limosilactobacillus mucosae]SFJ82872.1 Uncharacterized conserved protein YeaO, DUF488 family [Limosilactobacillus mucosae]
MKLKLDRIYDKPADLNGWRILIDRRWPRGISKTNTHLDEWAKGAAPSEELRKWFNHDPARFAEFKERYLKELAGNPAYLELLASIKKHLQSENVILLYGAKDRQHNQGIILAELIKQKLNL